MTAHNKVVELSGVLLQIVFVDSFGEVLPYDYTYYSKFCLAC